MNFVESSVSVAFDYMGVTDVRTIAVEFDEFADARLQASIARAEADVDSLVETLLGERDRRKAA